MSKIFNLIQENSIKYRAANGKENACTRVPCTFFDSPGFCEEIPATPVPELGLWLLLFSSYSINDNIMFPYFILGANLSSETMAKILSRMIDRNEAESTAYTAVYDIIPQAWPHAWVSVDVLHCLVWTQVYLQRAVICATPLIWSAMSSEDNNGSLIHGPCIKKRLLLCNNSSLYSGKIDRA